jgi:hypothetical protein
MLFGYLPVSLCLCITKLQLKFIDQMAVFLLIYVISLVTDFNLSIQEKNEFIRISFTNKVSV